MSILFPRPPTPTLFPYTTLFRSDLAAVSQLVDAAQTQAIAHALDRLAELMEQAGPADRSQRSEEHTSELQSRGQLVCRLLLEKKKRLRNEGIVNDTDKSYKSRTR